MDFVASSKLFRGTNIAVHGKSVASSCCAHLLGGAGFPLCWKEGDRPRVPAILLSEDTQALLCDLYGRPELFHGLFRIDRRVVAWGSGVTPVELPHRALVISEEALLQRLDPKLVEDPAPERAHWTIYASRPLPVSGAEHRFGSRAATATPVHLTGSTSPACLIESLESGWLFLVPESAGTGWLIAVGESLESHLAQSRLIAKQCEISGATQAAFPAYPRIVDPVCGPGWLACGTAALAFDPLCGDGTGYAVREAILAAAVIRAAACSDDVERLLAHYRARLIAGFLRHLELCRGFYASGGAGPWWKQEAAALAEGIAWCGRALPAVSPFQYRLNGFDLEPIPVTPS